MKKNNVSYKINSRDNYKIPETKKIIVKDVP